LSPQFRSGKTILGFEEALETYFLLRAIHQLTIHEPGQIVNSAADLGQVRPEVVVVEIFEDWVFVHVVSLLHWFMFNPYGVKLVILVIIAMNRGETPALPRLLSMWGLVIDGVDLENVHSH